MWALNNILHGIIRNIMRVMSPILNLIFYITLLIVVLTWSVIPIKIAYIIVICTTNCMIPPTTNA